MFTHFYTKILVPDCASEASAVQCVGTSGDIVREILDFSEIGKNGVGWEMTFRMSLVFAFSDFLKKFREGLGLMRACLQMISGVVERSERAQRARLVRSREGWG
jgi:hypothetical protein